ncbi:uncharacterized protein BDW43DRAFT_61269 [Aspergillus alliaceus]|uniref:uncharacterized protein n=1 Tax=Petromyces alliaceus TaxID=209559 RepID=UPI0012A4F971|nr:uncharacterized protein BDW43DRAFT_61269 [Aspergillus alliaceus]KAB8234406.1 hypothetical protein BDW43DRAFT_61269 [Aspergillus alliaceus]
MIYAIFTIWEAISQDHLRVFRLREEFVFQEAGSRRGLRRICVFLLFPPLCSFSIRWPITRLVNLDLSPRPLCYTTGLFFNGE